MSQSYDKDIQWADPSEYAWVGVRLEPGESMTEYMKGKSDMTPSDIDGFAKSKDCAAIIFSATFEAIGMRLYDCSGTSVSVRTFFCQLGT